MGAESAPSRRAPANTDPAAITTLPAAGSPRHAAWLYAPPERRDALAALLALEREVAASAAPSLAHDVAHVRLAWWHEEAKALSAGQPRHPLTRHLLADAQRRNQPRPDLRPWVISVGQQLAKVAWVTRDELRSHIQLWVDAVWMNALRLTAASAQAADFSTEALREAGYSLRELELLTNLAGAARGGCVNLPIDELQKSSARTADCYGQPWNAAICALIRERLQCCRSTISAAEHSWPEAQLRGGRGLAAWIAVAQREANRMQQTLPLQYHAESLSFPAAAGDAFAAWRAARRAQQRAAARRSAS